MITRLGACPVFVDIDPNTFNLDSAQVGQKITSQTKAVMPVHLFGQCAEMNPIMELVNGKGIHVIEDATQAIALGIIKEGKPTRSGTWVVYLCSPPKSRDFWRRGDSDH
jgi:dTDP-4-amino-4,6-dideoxygalactose transaminase